MYLLYDLQTSSTAASLTDNSNLWAPERLLYEHQLFTVFQSVKFRGYYLSCDGKGVVRLQQVINVAYRSPEQLFITIDPGELVSMMSSMKVLDFGNIFIDMKIL